MKLDLTKEQQSYLIKIGLQTLLNGHGHLEPKTKTKAKAKPVNNKKSWTPEQRRKFRATMQKKWAEKKAAERKENG